MSKFIRTVNHGTNQINLSHLSEISQAPPIEVRPVELHYKEDGAVGNAPSFVMVFHDPFANRYSYGQFSLDTLGQSLRELGIEIKYIPVPAAKDNIINLRMTETGKNREGKKEYEKRVIVQGQNVLLFTILAEAIHKNPEFKMLVIAALKFDNEHDHANCPHCRAQN